MTVQDVRDILVATGIKVSHFDSDVLTVPYIVFAESRESDAYDGDDAKTEQAMTVNVYFVTPYEYDTRVNDIQAAFIDAELSYRLTSVEYIRDIMRIQYTWALDILCDPEAVYGNPQNNG